MFTERPILDLSLLSVKYPLTFLYLSRGKRNQPEMREPVPFSKTLLYKIYYRIQSFTLMRGWNIFWSLVVDWIKLPIIDREIRSDSKSEFELVLTPKPLPTSDELQVKIESPENFMKMRFALAGSCRREDIPACGRGRGTGLLGRSDKP